MATSWSERGAWGEVLPLDDDAGEQATSRTTPPPRALRGSRRRLGPPQPEAPKRIGPTKSTFGAAGEDRAVALLEAKGFEIVERNFKTKIGELDIVARDRGTLVFVEVRSRTDATRGSALDAIPIAKRRRVARMAQQYITWRRPSFAGARFDVVAITGNELVHIVDAWRL